MAFKDDLVTARSYIVFVLGLITAFVMVYYIEQHSKLKTQIPPTAMVKSVIKLDQEKSLPDTMTPNTAVPTAVAATVIQQPKQAQTTVTHPTAANAKPNPLNAASQMMADVSTKEPIILASIELKTPTFGKRSKQKLTEQELQWAKIAWQYFVNNTQKSTGLVNSVQGYPATTLWDTASYMMAAIAAQRLSLIEQAEFDQRMSSVLNSLAIMPLVDNKLPNKSYNTISLAMTNYANKDSPKGIGWSAIDIGRLLVPLKILQKKYPQHQAMVQKVLGRWSIPDVVHHNIMFGAAVDNNGNIKLMQEGRLGYEQYAAKTFALFNHQAKYAASYVNHLQYVDIYGIEVAVDKRDPKTSGAQNYVLSEPYILDGLEFGFDKNSKELAARLFLVQQARYKNTGILTAVSEDHIDVAPYFVYNTVYVAGKTWAAITDKGQDASAFKSLSTKTVFGWHALYNTDYSKKMLDAIKDLHDTNKGWYSGLYEQNQQPNKAITANTNGVVLESLAYIQLGKLLP
ncbi:MAG: DUF3131 domain-containing protein [Pseudomonadales bacterium]|nr:DUF3131 domain-containing protein [Pseudomonadales bacterium]